MKRKLSVFVFTSLFVTAATSASEKGIYGDWDFHVPTPSGEEIAFVSISNTNGLTEGFIQGKFGRSPLHNLKIEGNKFSFEQTVKKFFIPFTFKFEGLVEGDTITGAIYTPDGPKDFNGHRTTD